jgi:hypothetical protein
MAALGFEEGIGFIPFAGIGCGAIKAIVEQVAPTERNPDKEDHYPVLEQVSLTAIRSRSIQ